MPTLDLGIATTVAVDTPGIEIGIPGPSGDPGIAIVEHGTNPAIARPSATIVFWYGTVEPDNWIGTDIWVDNA